MSGLGKKITRKSSYQTYLTIRLLVDRGLRESAYDSYAYFRWLDDEVDRKQSAKAEKLLLLRRQKRIIDLAYRGKLPKNLRPEEELIVKVISTNRSRKAKLYAFITKFYEVIHFDARRNGRAIKPDELERYTATLSRAVMSGLRYFIHTDYHYPESRDLYAAAKAAHILHMLRDYQEDLEEGYINIPDEFVDPRKWTRARVGLAGRLMKSGKAYILSLPYLRAKLAGMWYCARFERLIKEFRQNNYDLNGRPGRYSTVGTYLYMAWVAFKVILRHAESGSKRDL